MRSVPLADLVVIVVLRELGPLLAAFVLAARTGSAFAAKIGAMKVDEDSPVGPHRRILGGFVKYPVTVTKGTPPVQKSEVSLFKIA